MNEQRGKDMTSEMIWIQKGDGWERRLSWVGLKGIICLERSRVRQPAFR